MRLRSLLALCAATATAVSVLGVPAGARRPRPRSAPQRPATATSVRSPQIGSTGSLLGFAKPCVPRTRTAVPPSRRRDPGGRHRAAVDRASTTSTAGCTGRSTRCGRWATRSRSGWPTTPRSRPATAAHQVPGHDHRHRRAGQELADQFDSNMFPKESQAFSVAPDRDGSGNVGRSGVDFTGDGDKIVTLVDNVRDDNYYEFPAAPTYIAGLLLLAVQRAARPQRDDDRRVRLAAPHRRRTRPDEPTADLCTSRPARPTSTRAPSPTSTSTCCSTTPTRPRSTGSTRACPTSPILVGYGDARRHGVRPKGAESHIYCFQGFGTVQTPYNPNPRDCGGPENSLTLWGDQGSGNEILADYGNALVVHAVPLRPLRHRLHVGAAPRRRRAGPGRRPGPARRVRAGHRRLRRAARLPGR